MLRIEVPVGVGNGVNIQHAVVPFLFFEVGEARIEYRAINAAVNNNVGDVNALRAPISCHSLGQRSQRRFG